MGYPKDNLAPDETVILHRHPHWKALVLPVLGLLLATGAVGAAWWWSRSLDVDDTTETVIGIVAGVLWAVLVIWWFVAPLVRWATTHFVITDRRVIFRTGVFTRSGIDIPMARINSIQFRHDLVDRILRTGTLIIESASDDPLEFNDIPQVERVHALLYHEVHDYLTEDDDETAQP